MKKYLEWFIYAIILIFGAALLSLFIFGCSPVKQVLKDPKKTDIVGREWEKTHGCVTQTTVEYLPGKDVTTFDTSYSTDIILSTDSFETNTAVIRWKERIITRTTTRTDTFVKNIEDIRRITGLRQDTARLNGQIIQLTADRKAERKRGNNWLYAFLGACGVIGVGVFFKLKKAI